MKTHMTSAIIIAASLTLTGTMSFADTKHHNKEAPSDKVETGEPFVGQSGMSGMGDMGAMQGMGGNQMKMMQSMMQKHAKMMRHMGGGNSAQEALLRDMLDNGQADIAVTMTAHDASKDGTLDLEEFAHWYAAIMREQMVDGFQHLDADGTGGVTSEELATAANRMETSGSMASTGSTGSMGDNMKGKK